jgi:LmbE family N-acetylglucosaminyl deacetylase
MEKNKILVVVAHPDDEILSCGGTIAKLVKKNNSTVKTVILGEGVKSRDNWTRGEYGNLRNSINNANRIIGVEEVIPYDFPDNRFDSVPLLDIVKTISKIKDDYKPDVVFTHCRNDLNVDHRIVYEAVITVCRPMASESVKEIYSGEVLSSTEWNFPVGFNPNVFFDITNTIDAKLSAMKEYIDELRIMPHPRSLEGIRKNAELWGIKMGMYNAEAFECIRMIK